MDEIRMTGFTVILGTLFKKEYQFFPEIDKQYINKFIFHLQAYGFSELEGVNKRSDDVRKDDPYFAQKVKYAQEHHLWHYHIGIKQYDMSKPFGKRTSEYILHYQLLGDTVRIVDYSAHPPFKLPAEDYLK